MLVSEPSSNTKKKRQKGSVGGKVLKRRVGKKGKKTDSVQ